MKSKKVHPSLSGSQEDDGKDIKDAEEADKSENWFHFDEETDNVSIDLEAVEQNNKNKKSKFEIFLAKIKDENSESEDGDDEKEGREENEKELLLKT